MSTETKAGEAKLPRVLGPTAAFCVVVGSVIGSGIFIVPATVAQKVPFLGGIAFVWVVGGLFSMAGALTLAELSAMLPSAGGPYVYLREAFGRLPAFLFGWAEFLVIRTGSIAGLAAAFGLNFALIVPRPHGLKFEAWQTLAAVCAIVIVATINVVGTRFGGRVQVIGTALKIGALLTMIVLPFMLGKADPALLKPIGPKSFDSNIFAGIMAAMIGVLWTYDGWVNASALAEDIRDPGKNIPRALILGLCALIAIYLGMTLVYHLVIPLGEVINPPVENGSKLIISANFLKHLIGDWGKFAIAIVIMASTFITLNGNALSGPRAYFAMARDGVFPRSLCKIDPTHQTPANAIIAQMVWAVILMVSASAFILVEPPSKGLPPKLISAWVTLHEKPLYDVLYTYVIFGGTIFYGLSILSVFVLRAKRPDLPRPYKTWGYPITPLLYTAASLLLLWSMIDKSPFESLAGLAIIAAGVPAYWFFTRAQPSDPAKASIDDL
jgi:APA family basic amino acid/polyamine antiporter